MANSKGKNLLPGPAGAPGAARKGAHTDVMLAIGVATVLATLVLPLPTFLLDVMLACSIAIALGTLLIVLSAKESIELSTFPSLLLFLTLFRLSLNVASTRLILLNGDAGKIIETFGNFVAGGSLVIGLVVFLILVVIQFIVITKGSERISEVAARFNLDAMPGKQMAIDADLNAGLIGEDDARSRRKKIVEESEFYGAMDGASKFIRGDAVAGLIITSINLVGGFVIGMINGMSAGDSIATYSVLAIGDGLISQIPAIIISTSAGFLITKTSSQSDLSTDLGKQLFSRSRPLTIASFLFGSMVLVPGFPKIPFVALAIGSGMLAKSIGRRENQAPQEQAAPTSGPAETPVEELLDIDKIAIQVGSRLIKIIDPRRKSSLSHRISPLRRKFAQQYGMVLPLVRLRDNPTLDSGTYEIRLHNHVAATGKLEPDKHLAMDPGTVSTPINGVDAREPVFDLPALWITESQKAEAQVAGYTVVDSESVLITHLSEILRRHAHELLSRDDVQLLIDRLRERQPALVNSAVGDASAVGLVHRVLQNLLRDSIPIRDLAQILETIGDHATRTKDPAILTELSRKALTRTITEQHIDAGGRIAAIVLEPALEYELRHSVRKEDGGSEAMSIGPDRAMAVVRAIAQAWRSAMDKGLDKVVLLCDYVVRPHMAGMLARQVPQLSVIAYDEIVQGTNMEAVETVTLGADTVGAAANMAMAT